jgi:hypothetical protein
MPKAAANVPVRGGTGGVGGTKVEDLLTAGTAGQVPTSQGDGSLAMETPGGGGGGAVLSAGFADLELGEGGPPDPASTWDTTFFGYDLEVSNMILSVASGSRFKGIDAETGPVVASDPSSVISGTPVFFTDGDGYRQVRVTATGNTGSNATVTWTWNGKTFTLTVLTTGA